MSGNAESYTHQLFSQLPTNTRDYLKAATSKFKFFALDINAVKTVTDILEWETCMVQGFNDLSSNESTPINFSEVEWFWRSDQLSDRTKMVPDVTWGVPASMDDLLDCIEKGKFKNTALKSLKIDSAEAAGVTTYTWTDDTSASSNEVRAKVFTLMGGLINAGA